MLVADFGAPGRDRRCPDKRVVQRPVGREERPAVRRVNRLAAERAAEIGRDADVVADLIAEAVAGGRAPRQIVLAPGEEIAGQRTAVTLILLVQE
jgi:hypothetical protein